MSRPRGSIIGARPTWTTTATSGIWTLRQAEEMKAAGQWPRGPVAPTSLAGTPGDQQVALTWVAPATPHGTITDYVVEYTPAAGSPTVVATGSTAASYTLTGLANDTEYNIRVAGVNFTRGDWSDSVAVTPAVAVGWDISTAVFSQSFSVAAQDTLPLGLAFSQDGTRMYVLGQAGADINEYSLSTAWDISTASYTQNFSVSGQEIYPQGLFFKPDGTRLYVSGEAGADINEYSLSTAWDISTASYTQNFSVSGQDSKPAGIYLSVDGLKAFMVGSNSDNINEYSLSTAWDISTATYTQNFSVSGQDSNPWGLFFRANGLTMFMAGQANSNINEYSLSTAWDISTASFVRALSVSAKEAAPRGLFFKTDGLKLFVNGNVSDSVHEYDLTPV